uniref:F-box/LRR-repeat protein At3g58900-like n=1 Tax=Erigeron canadensis TaxID=72917 RepID=UPI001CB89689|nr:F-box/LRR-repeat protein At3g58900-like [Erigeron canadensis]XP_043620726.1 F-box/LRR-repeat protein At3g58900-like [Erigeron canadensis]
MNESKEHKQNEAECIGDMIDGISSLPDCILHHILSFLPTTEVVKTSILSKRWKNLWASVSNIDFDDSLLYASEMDGRRPPEVTSFMNFVDRVLRLRDASSLEKFRLSCRICFDASRIHSWISDAILHNVRELDLCLLAGDTFVIPRSMFDGTSLVSLKIEMNCVINLPSLISFPCLKILHLALVTFLNDSSTEKLFSGCPVLEELVLLDCEWMNLKNVVICSSTLKSLTIDDLPSFGQLDDPTGCKLIVDTINLTYLEYIGYLSNEIFLNNLPSLVEACIHIPIPHVRQKEVALRAVDLLKSLRYVVSLRVSNRTLESLITAESMVDHFPVFSNLGHLMLTMEVGNYTLGAVMDLLTLCPTLQSLSLSEGFELCMRIGENSPIWLSIPICMSYHLKAMTFKNFHANDSEICFLKCILKYACVLEKLDIWWCKTPLFDLKKQSYVRKELKMVDRSRTPCVITFF